LQKFQISVEEAIYSEQIDMKAVAAQYFVEKDHGAATSNAYFQISESVARCMTYKESRELREFCGYLLKFKTSQCRVAEVGRMIRAQKRNDPFEVGDSEVHIPEEIVGFVEGCHACHGKRFSARIGVRE
jgi:hypothetical protein